MKNLLNRLISTASLIVMATVGSAQDAGQDTSWERGWIAQSYGVPIGADAPKPGDLLLNTWLDSGRGLFTTDYLFAFSSQRTYIFNAGILRSGAIRIDQPGTYRLHVFLDRFLGHGQPECRARIALDGATVIDSSAGFEQRDASGISSNNAAIMEARRFHESQQAASPVLQVTEPGYYRIDFWSFCRDLNDKQAAYNLSNELGNRVEKRGVFGTSTRRVQSFYSGDSQVLSMQNHRMQTNPIKQVIAENHSTMFDLVLENIETGEKGRINGQNIWHNKSFSPSDRLEYDSLPPQGQVSFTSSPWVFTGIRGELSGQYVQDAGYSPAFRTAASRMPFVPGQIEARKRISISRAGTYDVALGYEPLMTSSAFLTSRGNIGRGGQVIVHPESEPVAIFIEKKMDDGRHMRLKMFEGALVGSNLVGEIRFMKINFEEGDYDIVITRDSGRSVVRNRYGDVDMSASFSNSQLSLRLKHEDDTSFMIAN